MILLWRLSQEAKCRLGFHEFGEWKPHVIRTPAFGRPGYIGDYGTLACKHCTKKCGLVKRYKEWLKEHPDYIHIDQYMREYYYV
ncbi:hypothetical protein SEA_KEELAN_13 [Gordonia phage Keelan]|nr:hypothetical protein SEA_KEELAN_13 [Gordonia phage Keelan]